MPRLWCWLTGLAPRGSGGFLEPITTSLELVGLHSPPSGQHPSFFCSLSDFRNPNQNTLFKTMAFSFDEWAEALSIINEHCECDHAEPLHPMHEKIIVHGDPANVPEEDLERLEELHFHAAPDRNPPHFYVFT